jgi:hypothetical protein
MQTVPTLSPRYYARKHHILPLSDLDKLKTAILASSYLADSQLSDRFTGTKGFSIVFKRSGIPTVLEQFPYFEPYLQIALKQACNAFYLNPLILETGSQVEPHVDCSLSAYEWKMLIPNLVSILYVQVPDDLQGGELVLRSGDRLLAQIPPQTNTLLYFIGHLTHSVNPVQSSQARISLICEQYTLDSTRLAFIPEFEVRSGAETALKYQ